MKRILLIGNHDVVIYNFRLELIEALLGEGYQVSVALPYGDKVEQLRRMGCLFFETPIKRHGMNLLGEGRLFLLYLKIMRELRPDFVLTYTIKPNIYGGAAAGLLHIPCAATVTGLGNAVRGPRALRALVSFLYRAAFRRVRTVYFQNLENQQFFAGHGIPLRNQRLVSGSGVNLERFPVLPYPKEAGTSFVFVGRVMREKGVEEYLEAAGRVRREDRRAEFHICGFLDGDYREKLKRCEEEGIVIYHGMVEDIRAVLKDMHCAVLPSYHEGMSNALLEAAACGRPLLASGIPGCREIVEEGVNGFLFRPGDAGELTDKITQFLRLPYEEKRRMGIRSREKVEREFDRREIVEAYMEEIRSAAPAAPCKFAACERHLENQERT